MRLLLLSLLLLAPTAFGAPAKLGVLIVIDQISADQFERRLPTAKAGIKRLADKGFRFKEMRYDTAPTLTAVGHSTLVTGAYPSLHGVVSNGWFDTAANAHRNAAQDPRYLLLNRTAKEEDSTAPTAQRVSSMSEALKTRYPESKVISIAAKGRSAAMMGGGAANLALWVDVEGRPLFTTSSYYADRLPDFVTEFNAKFSAQFPADAMERMKSPKPRYDSADHGVDEWPALQPLFARATVDLAIGAVDAFSLGKSASPDLLLISFSGYDEVAHAKGPDSPELDEMWQVVDAEIGRLLAALDAKTPGYVVALAADHGGGQVPEELSKRRIFAGRVDTKTVLAALEKEADAALGAADYFRGYWTPGYHAHSAQLQKLESILPRLRDVARAQPGVFDLLSARAVMNGTDKGPLSELYRNGIYIGRSPDFILVPKPYWHYGLKDLASHGTPWLYDRCVPLIFFGKSLRQGFAPLATAVDVAPTLAALLGFPPPAATIGRALPEVLSARVP